MKKLLTLSFFVTFVLASAQAMTINCDGSPTLTVNTANGEVIDNIQIPGQFYQIYIYPSEKQAMVKKMGDYYQVAFFYELLAKTTTGQTTQYTWSTLQFPETVAMKLNIKKTSLQGEIFSFAYLDSGRVVEERNIQLENCSLSQ